MDPSAVGKLLLRDAHRLAQFPDVPTEACANIHAAQHGLDVDNSSTDDWLHFVSSFGVELGLGGRERGRHPFSIKEQNVRAVFQTMAAASLLIAGPASAHWQYTQWGMSPDQVIAASRGAAHAGSGEKSASSNSVRSVEGSFLAGDQQFRAAFYFDKGGLSTVSLSTHGVETCNSTGRDLQAVYGQPVEVSGGMVASAVWLDRVRGNRVKFIQTMDYCELQYSSLASSAANEL